MGKFEKLILEEPTINMSNKNDPISNAQLADMIGGIQSAINNWANNLLGNLDHMNVRRLYTNYCDIKSADGETVIDGPLLMMYDKQATPVLRLMLGYDSATSKFVFNMYDAAGSLTLTLNSSGEAVFAGNISTLKDAFVGNNLHLGAGGTSTTRVIYFNDYMNITAKADSGWVIQFNCGILEFIGTLRGEWGFSSASVTGLEDSGYATESWVTSNYQPKISGATGSFTTVDGKTVSVSNGIVTSIV